MVETTPSIKPQAKYKASNITRNGAIFCSALSMLITMYMVFIWVPTEQNLGIVQRIFYYHVPLAWIGMLSIILVAITSAMYLLTRNQKWDNLAYSIAELGVIFISILLISGIIWDKPMWGVWWTWDARLTTTLILWFIYVSYLMMRAYGPKGSQGARYGAIIALIGAIDAPIIYMTTVWWRTVHPGLNIGPLAESGGLDPRMQLTLWISMIAFTILYVVLLTEIYSLKRGENDVNELHRQILYNLGH